MNYLKTPLCRALMAVAIGTTVWVGYNAAARRGHLPPNPSSNAPIRRDLDEATNGQALLQERNRKRLGKGNTIPVNALVLAREQEEKMKALPLGDPQVQDGGIWNWEWLGPGNIGGRVRAIGFSGDNIIMGGVSGGIWRSSDLGASWMPMDDFMASLNVSTLAVDPSNPTTIYAGTGEGFSNIGSPNQLPHYVGGGGIFKSINGGTTWTQLPATIGWAYIMRLAAHPSVVGTIFAATINGLFKSTDSGGSWTQVLNVNCWDVKIDPANPTRMIASTTPANGSPAAGGDTYVSTSSGNLGTWTRVSTGGAGKLPTLNGSTELAIGAFGQMWASINRNGGEIWRSTDPAGLTWTRQSTGVGYLGGFGDYANDIWASPDDPTLVVVGGLDLWRSTDGGVTLTKISDWSIYHTGGSAHSDQHIIISPNNYSSNHNLYVGNDGGVQRLVDVYAPTFPNLITWENLAHNLGITQFYGAAAFHTGQQIIAGAQDNSTLRYRASGAFSGTQGWYQSETGDGGFCAYANNDINVCYMEYIKLQIKKSTNGGDSYTDSTNGITDRAAALFIAPFVIDPNFDGTLLGGSAIIWRTANAAANWGPIRVEQPTNPPTNPPTNAQVSALAIDPTTPFRYWAGYSDGRISHTINNQVNQWVDVQNNGTTPPTHRFITDIAVSPSYPSEVFVTVGGYGSDTVWFTSDGGQTWQNRNGIGASALPPVQVNTITFHPIDPSWVYVGTDLGVYASEDEGLTWNLTPRFGGNANNDGPVHVEVDRLVWQGDSLLAATFGRGMFRTRPLSVIYVDKRNTTGVEDGTPAHPYNTVQEGLNVAGNGSVISVEANDYAEGYKFVSGKRVKLISTNGTTRIR